MKHLFTFFIGLTISFCFAQTPTHSYNLNNSLAETGGTGPTLVVNGGAGSFGTSTVCGTSKTVYQFAAGQGLDYNVGATFTNTYSIETVFQFANVTSYARVLDYKNLTLDDGLYVVGGNLNFYPVANGAGSPIAANTYVHVVLTRNAAGTVVIYVNGCQHFTFNDAGNRSITDAANKIVFFKDNGGENSAGAVSEIHIFNSELTAAQVTSRYNTFCPSPPPPSPTPVVYEYLLNNDFLESSGKPGPLVPLGTGNFTTESFSNCGTKSVYNFDQNSGLQFDNTTASNFFGDEYTIELYFKFQNLTSWRRIVDFKNRTSDTGPYAFNNQIQFYNVITSGTFPFAANTYAHVVFTREVTAGACAASAKTINMYVDGTLRATFSDATDLGVLSAANVLNFFQDDLVVGNEASAGTIAVLRLYNYVLVPADVALIYADVPCPILLNTVTTKLTGKRQEKEVLLAWENQLIPAQASYQLQRSFNGYDWETIGSTMPWNKLAFTDFNPSNLSSYYRLKIDWDQQHIYTNMVAIQPYSIENLVIYPNPIRNNQVLTIHSNFENQQIKVELTNSLGQVVYNTKTNGHLIYQINLPKLAAGVYGVRIIADKTNVSKLHTLVVQ